MQRSEYLLLKIFLLVGLHIICLLEARHIIPKRVFTQILSCIVLSLQHVFLSNPLLRYFLDFSQVEAKRPEGCRLHGHGEEQCWCRSV